jgi:hypothetical protein
MRITHVCSGTNKNLLVYFITCRFKRCAPLHLMHDRRVSATKLPCSLSFPIALVSNHTVQGKIGQPIKRQRICSGSFTAPKSLTPKPGPTEEEFTNQNHV